MYDFGFSLTSLPFATNGNFIWRSGLYGVGVQGGGFDLHFGYASNDVPNAPSSFATGKCNCL